VESVVKITTIGKKEYSAYKNHFEQDGCSYFPYVIQIFSPIFTVKLLYIVLQKIRLNLVYKEQISIAPTVKIQQTHQHPSKHDDIPE